MFKKMVVSVVVFLVLASVASAQPPRMSFKGKVKELGDPERLEKPAPPQDTDRQRMERERGPWAMPGEFRSKDPRKNKYGGPVDDMRGWGGSPFKPFTGNNPWGRIDNGAPFGKFGGPVGPSRDFRRDFVPHRGGGWQGKRGWSDSKVPPFKGEFGQNHKDRVGQEKSLSKMRSKNRLSYGVDRSAPPYGALWWRNCNGCISHCECEGARS